MKVRIKLTESARKPLEGSLEIKGPCDTGSIVTTVTGFVVGKMSRMLLLGGIEIEVEPSVYKKYQEEGWKEAY